MPTSNPKGIPAELIDDSYLSFHQIAALDGTSVDTVRRQAKRGDLPVTRLSARRIGVRRSAYLIARRKNTTSQD